MAEESRQSAAPRREELDLLLPAAYARLRRLAAAYMERERGDHTLQPTALVHEVYMRLATSGTKDWQSQRHFLSAAALVMRRVLIDHARSRLSARRGGGLSRQPLGEEARPDDRRAWELLQLDRALMDLAARDSRKARVVELRFFGSLTIEETAAVLKVSAVTVVREWRMARAWLHDAVAPGG